MAKAEKNTLPNSNTVGKGVSGTSKNESKKSKSTETEVERELQKLKDNDKVHGIVREEFDAIKADRYRIDWKMKIAELFYRGDIYAQYNKNTLAIETPKPKRGEIRVELPIIKTLVDANVTDLIKDKPEWDVLPESYDDKHVQEAKWNNLLLDYFWEQQDLAEKVEQVAKSGIVKSIGILEAGWDPDRDTMYYDVVRPEDLYVNPKANSFEDAIAIFKVIAKDTATVRNNPLYKPLRDKWWHELKADKDYTESDELKTVQDRDTGVSQNSTGNTSRGTVLLVEGYYKYYEDGKWKYRIVTFGAKQPLLFRNDEVEYGRMPWFFPFHSDKHPGEIYGQGKVIPVASAVKNIADIVSKTVRHHQIFTNGAYVVDRGADPMVVDGEAGKIIYKQPGRALTPLTIPQLPSSAYEQVQQLMNFVMDSAGVHETSLGRPPAKIESARGLESLTFGDQQAKAMMKQSFERFLVNVAKYTLKCVSMNMSDEKIVKIYDDEGTMQKFAARGSESFGSDPVMHPETGQPVDPAEAYDAYENTLVVRPKEDVKVVIGSGLGNTPDARYAKAQELRETGLVPSKVVLKAARVPGNLKDIADQAWEESMRAEEARKDKPQPKDTKDYINTKFSDLSKDEQDQLIERYGIQVGKLPRPTSPEFQADIEDAKLPAKIQVQQAGNEHSQVAQLAAQEESSMNPLIEGGVVNPAAMLNGEEQNGSF